MHLSPDGLSLAFSSEQSDYAVYEVELNSSYNFVQILKHTNSSGGPANGVEYDATSSNLFIADPNGIEEIARWAPTRTSFTTVASSSSYNRTELQLGTNGQIYFSDNSGNMNYILTTSPWTVSTPTPPGSYTIGENGWMGDIYVLPKDVAGEDYTYFNGNQAGVLSYQLNPNSA